MRKIILALAAAAAFAAPALAETDKKAEFIDRATGLFFAGAFCPEVKQDADMKRVIDFMIGLSANEAGLSNPTPEQQTELKAALAARGAAYQAEWKGRTDTPEFKAKCAQTYAFIKSFRDQIRESLAKQKKPN